MNYWIISNNRKYYDLVECFKKYKTIIWLQKNRKIEVGDVVYVYITLPEAKIRYKCLVKEVEIELDNNSDFKEDTGEYWNEYDYVADSDIGMKLELLEEYDNTIDLSLKKIEEYGLKRQSLQSQRYAPLELVEYIERKNRINKFPKIIYCRVGWMENYDGQIKNADKIKNGGRYIKEQGYGHEIYNFQKTEQGFFGYVRNTAETINIKNITGHNDDFVNDVLVVWIASNDNGQYVIGWYKNATVYKKQQKIANDVMKYRDDKRCDDYNIFSQDATLLPTDKRIFKIEGMGQAGVWYGSDEVNEKVLKYIENYDTQNEIEISIIENGLEKLEGEERNTIIKQRINQGKYRNNLFVKYGSKCFLCGVARTDLLIASHIKPWNKSNKNEKVDTYNGLILCPNHDKLFDRGLISFDDEGNILISNELEPTDRLFCNIHEDMKITVEEESRKFMKYHRENIFKK